MCSMLHAAVTILYIRDSPCTSDREEPSGTLFRLRVVPQGSGTRTKILTRIMVSRSEVDLARIKQEYKKTFGKTLYQEILVSKRLGQL